MLTLLLAALATAGPATTECEDLFVFASRMEVDFAARPEYSDVESVTLLGFSVNEEPTDVMLRIVSDDGSSPHFEFWKGESYCEGIPSDNVSCGLYLVPGQWASAPIVYYPAQFSREGESHLGWLELSWVNASGVTCTLGKIMLDGSTVATGG